MYSRAFEQQGLDIYMLACIVFSVLSKCVLLLLIKELSLSPAPVQ